MIRNRLNLVHAVVFLVIILVVMRLFYWQVVKSSELQAMAEKQHLSKSTIPTRRGDILASDRFPLASSKESYTMYAYLPHLTSTSSEVVDALMPIVGDLLLMNEGSISAKNQNEKEVVQSKLKQKLEDKDKSWVALVTNLIGSKKKAIENMNIDGLGFELDYIRDYPEASMAANLLGFVGKDTVGEQKGYFGLEGMYNLELQGRSGIVSQEKDASGKPILIGEYYEVEAVNGRSLVLTIDRAIQKIVEESLQKGLSKYQANSGDIIVMNPKTGNIIAMASYPSYDPASFQTFEKSLYPNPSIADSYEPGSTFKVIVMSSALDAGLVSPDTVCDICAGPVKIGAYTIGTWNDEYHPEITMRDVIRYSDNVGMVYVGKKLGRDKMLEYLEKFGVGDKTGIDLEEEQATQLRKSDDWREIDVATAAFGQGVAVTGIQMVRAVAAIANDGYMPTPRVVDTVIGESEVQVPLQNPTRVVSKETARQVTEMMINAVDNGEAKWAKPKGYEIAGKTGTAQIPVAGHYEQEKTIASFIGFAPAYHPKFIMLVKLREPKSSPWGSETAAPLWFSIAKELFLYYGIQPKK